MTDKIDLLIEEDTANIAVKDKICNIYYILVIVTEARIKGKYKKGNKMP